MTDQQKSLVFPNRCNRQKGSLKKRLTQELITTSVRNVLGQEIYFRGPPNCVAGLTSFETKALKLEFIASFIHIYFEQLRSLTAASFFILSHVHKSQIQLHDRIYIFIITRTESRFAQNSCWVFLNKITGVKYRFCACIFPSSAFVML